MIVILRCGPLQFAVEATSFAELLRCTIESVGEPSPGHVLALQYAYKGVTVSVRCESTFRTFAHLSAAQPSELRVVQHAPPTIPALAASAAVDAAEKPKRA